MNRFSTGQGRSLSTVSIPLVIDLGSGQSTPENADPEPRQWLRMGFSRWWKRRTLIASLSGAVCMVGLLAAFTPTEASGELVSPGYPSATPAPSVAQAESKTMLGPREYLEARLSDGTLEDDFTGVSNPTVSLLSRNGDVVLLSVSGNGRTTSESPENAIGFTVLLVRSHGAWTVRNIQRTQTPGGRDL